MYSLNSNLLLCKRVKATLNFAQVYHLKYRSSRFMIYTHCCESICFSFIVRCNPKKHFISSDYLAIMKLYVKKKSHNIFILCKDVLTLIDKR